MLRTLATHFPLQRLAAATSPQLIAQARPALTTVWLLPRLREFSTKKTAASDNKEESSIPIDKKGNNNNPTTAPMHSKRRTNPWEHFFPAIGGTSAGFDDVFARDPFFTRDPFLQSFWKEGDPFERLRKEIMPVLHSRPSSLLNRTSSSSATNGKLLRASPGYEIKETSDGYEIALDIPGGLESKDLQVELERDGTIVHVSGEKSVSEDGMESLTRFSKRFSIGDGVDTEQLSANFTDGCLVIRAPKVAPDTTDSDTRKIPITNHPEISDEELRQRDYSDAFDESDWAETGKESGVKTHA